jgi:hypothetical protein
LAGIAIVALVKRVLWTVAAIVVLAGAATWGGLAWHRHATYGTIATEDHPTLTLDRGDRFSLAVRDHGPSIGDHWTAQPPAGDMISAAGHRNIPFSLLARIGIDTGEIGGGDGTTYFLYDARRSGTATVTLSNCYRGCTEPSPETRDVSWTITVR